MLPGRHILLLTDMAAPNKNNDSQPCGARCTDPEGIYLSSDRLYRAQGRLVNDVRRFVMDERHAHGVVHEEGEG